MNGFYSSFEPCSYLINLSPPQAILISSTVAGELSGNGFYSSFEPCSYLINLLPPQAILISSTVAGELSVNGPIMPRSCRDDVIACLIAKSTDMARTIEHSPMAWTRITEKKKTL